MEVGTHQGVCNNTPAESTSPENGWHSSIMPILSRHGKYRSSDESEGMEVVVKPLA